MHINSQCYICSDRSSCSYHMHHHQFNSGQPIQQKYKQTQQLSNDRAYPRPKTSLLFYVCFTNQVLYHGGEVLTMNSSQPEYVDCIVTEGETIVYSGEDVIIVIITILIMMIIITLSTILTRFHCFTVHQNVFLSNRLKTRSRCNPKTRI